VLEARALTILCASLAGPCQDCGAMLSDGARMYRCSTCTPPARRLCGACSANRHQFQALHDTQVSTDSGGWAPLRPTDTPKLAFPVGFVECPVCKSVKTSPSAETVVTLHVHTPVPTEHACIAATQAACADCASVFEVPAAVYGFLPAFVAGRTQWFDIQATSLYRGLLMKGRLSVQGYTEALEHMSKKRVMCAASPDKAVYRSSKLTTGEHAGFQRAMQLHREVDSTLTRGSTEERVFENCWCCEMRPHVAPGADHGVTVCQDGSYSVGPRQKARKALLQHDVPGMVPDAEVLAAVVEDSRKRGRFRPDADGRQGCSSHLKAIEGGHEVATSGYMSSMDKTGTVFGTCPHRCVKQSVVPMVTAERAVYFVLCLKKLTERGEQVKRVFCDIACVLKNTFKEHGLGRYHPGQRADGLWTCCGAPTMYLPDIGCSETQVLLPEVHSCNHSLACQVRTSVLFRPDSGKESSEGSEAKNATKQGFSRLSQGWGGDHYILEWQSIHSGDNREINEKMHHVLRDMWLLNERSWSRFDTRLQAVCEELEARAGHAVLLNDDLILGTYLPAIQARAFAMEAVTKSRRSTGVPTSDVAMWKFAEGYWHWLGVMVGGGADTDAAAAVDSFTKLAAAAGVRISPDCVLPSGAGVTAGVLMPGLTCSADSELVRQFPCRRCQELASYLEELACERSHVVAQLLIRKKDSLLHSRKHGLMERIKKLHRAHGAWAYLASRYSGHNVSLSLAEVLSPGSIVGRDMVTEDGALTSFGLREVARAHRACGGP